PFSNLDKLSATGLSAPFLSTTCKSNYCSKRTHLIIFLLIFSLPLKFLVTGPELGSNYSEVIAPQDVAVYGALCALASFDRSELKSKVIDNINFRNFLELVPEVRELVNDFYASRYGSCLEHLEKLKPNLLLDIHLSEHLETLYNDIRHKAIVRYTVPFIYVDLNTMASAFKSSVSMLEKELAALITENKIQRALQTGNEFERDIKAMLLRANIIKHDFTQKNWTGPRKLNLSAGAELDGVRRQCFKLALGQSETIADEATFVLPCLEVVLLSVEFQTD
ncbi:hypothetical protein ZWY2020_035643, partial [Hordeum vulgare]